MGVSEGRLDSSFTETGTWLIHVFLYLGRKSTLFPFPVNPTRSPRCSPLPAKPQPVPVLVLGLGSRCLPTCGETQNRTERGSRGCSRPAALTCVGAGLAGFLLPTPSWVCFFFPFQFSSPAHSRGERLGEAGQPVLPCTHCCSGSSAGAMLSVPVRAGLLPTRCPRCVCSSTPRAPSSAG